MREIRSTAELKKHVFESAIRDNVQFGKDEKGAFVLVRNFDDITLKDAKNTKEIKKGLSFKVYNKEGKIAFPNGKEKLQNIKSENTEITEHMRIPEKENVTREMIMKEIDDIIRSCDIYKTQMDNARNMGDIASYRGAKERLQRAVDKLDEKTVILAAKEKDDNLCCAVLAINAINFARLEFERALRQDMDLQMQRNTRENETRENPYAKHIKAMMEIKENLGAAEIDGLVRIISDVQKSGYGQETKKNIEVANAHQYGDDGVSRLKSGESGIKGDTTYEKVDVNDILENGPSGIDYGKALNAANEIEQEDKVRTLFDDNN